MSASLPEMTIEHRQVVDELWKSKSIHEYCYNVDRENYKHLLSEVFYELCNTRNILSIPNDRRKYYIIRMIINMTHGNKKSFYYRNYKRKSISFWIAHEFGRKYEEHEQADVELQEQEKDYETRINCILEHISEPYPKAISKVAEKHKQIWAKYMDGVSMRKVSKDENLSYRSVMDTVKHNRTKIIKRYERITR